MKKLNYQIEINCSKDKVFSLMLNDKHYREWTALFAPTSHYEGIWERGAKMYFFSENEKGEKGGMVSLIEELKPNEFVSIKHLAMVKNGKETPFEKGAIYENYYFSTKGSSTVLKVEMDTEEDWIEYFDKTWPKALQKLKMICEENCH